jgi:Tol biopolymer transport system component
VIVFSLVHLNGGRGEYTGGLHAISVGQGVPRQLTANPWDNDPSFSPSGTQIVFRRTNTPDAGIHMLDLTSGTTTQLLSREDDLQPTFGPRGTIAFLRFSRQTGSYDLLLRLQTGRLRRLTSTTATEGEPVFTPDGRRIVFSRSYARAVPLAGREGAPPPPALFSIRIDGSGLRRIGSASRGENFDVSPDGRRLVFSVLGSVTPEHLESKVWTKKLGGGGLKLVTRNASYPSYSPGGQQIVYSNYEGLWVRRADGGGERTLVLSADYEQGKGTLVIQPAWQPLP